MSEQHAEFSALAAQVAAEVGHVLARVRAEEVEQLVEAIIRTRRLFLAGRGRSGAMMNAFAIRLTHLDIHCHVVGESTTPSLQYGDVLIVGSGSGETITAVLTARSAQENGGMLAVITSRPESTLGAMADLTVVIPAPVREATTLETEATIQPMGSLFEQTLLLLLDTIVLMLKDRLRADERAMMARHSNLE